MNPERARHMSKVLVIEDDPDGRKSVVEAVQDAGCEVAASATGQEGLGLFRMQAFDAVLSDLVLPDIDGIQVLDQVRKINDQVPVLIMTAYGSVSTAVRALKAGAYDYIVKPLDLDDLQSKVLRAVETRRASSRRVSRPPPLAVADLRAPGSPHRRAGAGHPA